jgi:hypothetical protein
VQDKLSGVKYISNTANYFIQMSAFCATVSELVFPGVICLLESAN